MIRVLMFCELLYWFIDWFEKCNGDALSLYLDVFVDLASIYCWVLLLMYSHDTNLVCWLKLSLWHPPYCWALMKSMAYCGSWSQPSMLLLKVPQHVHD